MRATRPGTTGAQDARGSHRRPRPRGSSYRRPQPARPEWGFGQAGTGDLPSVAARGAAYNRARLATRGGEHGLVGALRPPGPLDREDRASVRRLRVPDAGIPDRGEA